MYQGEELRKLWAAIENLKRCKANCGSVGGEGWSLLGNAGTDSNVNFIGTTDDASLIFKQKGGFAGMLSAAITSFGTGSNSVGVIGITSIGSGSLAQSVGERNVAVGDNAGGTLITGDDNVFIGSGADSSSNTVSNAIALGSQAIAKSNQFAIPSTITSVKLGTLPEFANTAAALLGGLVAGELYMTTAAGSSVVKIVI